MTSAERKKLLAHLRASSRGQRGRDGHADRSEWARAWRRAMNVAIDAVNGVAEGLTFDQDSESWNGVEKRLPDCESMSKDELVAEILERLNQ